MSLYDHDARTIQDPSRTLTEAAGKVALVVNVASECGYTSQYRGLEALHRELGPRGFTVLAFPSNEFGGQEPGDHASIRAFCEAHFDVTFPIFEKCLTQPGEDQSSVFAELAAGTGALPSWNFCKYLVDQEGRVRGFYESQVTPLDDGLRGDIERLLVRRASES